jgi:ADP-heptose:LPS heptosyltransferase
LGDVINTLPLAVALKQELNATIHWLVAPLSYPLVTNHEAVDEVIVFDKKSTVSSLREISKKFKSVRYDIALDLQRTLKSGFFTSLSRADRKIGFDRQRCKEMTWLLPFERIGRNARPSHMLDQYMEFAAFLGIQHRKPDWKIPVFAALPKNLPAHYIVLNTGATKAANKWNPEKFALLADMIKMRLNIDIVLTGGPEDSFFAETIISNAKTDPVNMVGLTSVGELTEVIKKSMLTVSCDTGPMHLAVALGRKNIALFGPSDPVRTGPYNGVVIRKKIQCSPCNKKNCVAPQCMDLIMPEDVFDKVETVMSDKENKQ